MHICPLFFFPHKSSNSSLHQLFLRKTTEKENAQADAGLRTYFLEIELKLLAFPHRLCPMGHRNRRRAVSVYSAARGRRPNQTRLSEGKLCLLSKERPVKTNLYHYSVTKHPTHVLNASKSRHYVNTHINCTLAIEESRR